MENQVVVIQRSQLQIANDNLQRARSYISQLPAVARQVMREETLIEEMKDIVDAAQLYLDVFEANVKDAYYASFKDNPGKG